MDTQGKNRTSLSCILCSKWADFKFNNSDRDCFDLIKISEADTALLEWINLTLKIPTTSKLGICEMHFAKEDIIRGVDTQGRFFVELNDETVTPVYVTPDDTILNNTIQDFTELVEEHQNCLNLEPKWQVGGDQHEISFLLEIRSVIIKIKLDLQLTIIEGRNAFNGTSSLLKNHLENGKVTYWSRLRAIMKLCEDNSSLSSYSLKTPTDSKTLTTLPNVTNFLRKSLDTDWYCDVLPHQSTTFFQIEAATNIPYITRAVRIFKDLSIQGYSEGELNATSKIKPDRRDDLLEFFSNLSTTTNPLSFEPDNSIPNWDVSLLNAYNEDHIHDLHTLEISIQKVLPSGWQVHTVPDNYLVVFKPLLKEIPKIGCAIKITTNLHVSIYKDEEEEEISTYIPGFSNMPLMFSTLKKLIKFLEQQVKNVLNGPENGDASPTQNGSNIQDIEDDDEGKE